MTICFNIESPLPQRKMGGQFYQALGELKWGFKIFHRSFFLGGGGGGEQGFLCYRDGVISSPTNQTFTYAPLGAANLIVDFPTKVSSPLLILIDVQYL